MKCARDLAIVVAVCLLIGCGGGTGVEGSADNHGFGWQVDQTSALTGIGARASGGNSLRMDEIDALYYSTAACMQVIQADGKPPMAPRFVLYVAPPVDPHDKTINGREWNDGTIAVDATIAKGFYGYGAWRVTAHEMVHWLLFVTTGDADAAHRSDYFKTCVGGYTYQL